MHASICLLMWLYPMILASNINQNDLKSHSNWNLLPHDICGQRAFNETTSTDSSPYFGQLPWMVFLFDNHKNRKLNNPKCGGAIINKNYVLTTAYCCGRLNVENSRVRIGEFNISHNGTECNSRGCADPVKNLGIKEMVQFPGSQSSLSQDHICLIRLKNKIHFNDYVRPICLPVYENSIQSIDEGDVVQFAGLRELDSKLLQMSWPVISDKDCGTFYPRTQNEKFCLGFTKPQEDLDKNGCYGNAGHVVMKSLLVEEKTITYVIGLYARFNLLHLFACDIDLPKLFTKVSEYNKWILDSIAQ